MCKTSLFNSYALQQLSSIDMYIIQHCCTMKNVDRTSCSLPCYSKSREYSIFLCREAADDRNVVQTQFVDKLKMGSKTKLYFIYYIKYTVKKQFIKYLPSCCSINEIAKLIAPFINFQSWFQDRTSFYIFLLMIIIIG